MEQKELFSNDAPLSEPSKKIVIETMDSLVRWNSEEMVPHIKTAIFEYFEQLRKLVENG